MKVKVTANEEGSNVLLVVHDESGKAHSIIDKTLQFLKDISIVETGGDPPHCEECGGEGSVTEHLTEPTNDKLAGEIVCYKCKPCNGTGITNLAKRYGFIE